MDTRSELLSQTHSSTNGGEDMKEELAESLGRWTNGARSLDLNKKAAGKDLRQKEVTQHSREAAGKEKGEEERKRDAQRGPDRVLQFVHGAPEKKRVMEEEGSASRKSEVRNPLSSVLPSMEEE